jgi:hypothetical protein
MDSTGQVDFRTTFSATLPKRICDRPERPWVAMTIKSTSFCFAALIISKNAFQEEEIHRAFFIL